jgi:VIT1/CCC1 family predicted Fe2+/Mn2+ transporter
MTETTDKFLKFYKDERNSALLYQTLAEIEGDPRLSEVYNRIASTELQHADVWAEKIKTAGEITPDFHPTWRTRALIWLARRFGPAMILPSIQAMEQNGVQDYSQQPQAGGMKAQERSHAILVKQITSTMRGGIGGSALAQLEGRHRSMGGNALRAAVLGANDGLVSNLSLVMGVAGAAMNNRMVLITGLAGMLAGAISMALGEWLSVQSSRELFHHQIKIEAEEIEQAPEEEAEELALIYEARGLSREQAQTLATQLLTDKEHALETLAREELGMDPKELGGSAWEAAITSFVLFTLGAIVPVVSFAFLGGINAVIISILSSTVALFILGTVITLFTGRTVLYSGTRMVVFGLLAAAVTFGIGHLIGVSIGG